MVNTEGAVTLDWDDKLFPTLQEPIRDVLAKCISTCKCKTTKKPCTIKCACKDSCMNPFNKSKKNTDPVQNQGQMHVDDDSE